jgi:regulator of sigma E protease
MSIGPIILVAIGLGFVIFVHELGHFVLAKWAGVKVEAFSLGFGNVLLHYKKGDTDYRLSLIPLGGYVKMAGESQESGGPPKPGDLMAAPVWRRALIFVAGVAMNFITAFVMFIIAFRIGVSFPAAVVGDVELGSPAWVAGLEPGDRIEEVNGNTDTDFEELSIAAALSNGSKGVSLIVERDGQRLPFLIKPEFDNVRGMRLLGIDRPWTLRVGAIAAFGKEKDSPAQRAGIQVGDLLVAVNGQKLKSWSEFRALCMVNPGKPMSVVLDRKGKEITVTLTPRSVAPYRIGVSGMSSTVSVVRQGSLPAKLELVKGDKIVSVNGTPVHSWTGFQKALRDAKKAPVVVGIEGRSPISLDEATLAEKDRLFEGMIGERGLDVTDVVEGMPAAKAGLKPGDHLISLNGSKLRSWDEFASLVKMSEGKPITLVWKRDGKEVGPVAIQATADEKGAIGEVGIFPVEERVRRQYGLWKSCTVGTHKAILTVVQVYNTLAGIFSGHISPRNVGSIILIAQATYYSALEGIGKLLYFLGVLGINFAILNALPIPVLDGGHLLFLAFEKIKGSPVKERTMAVAQYAGLILLLGLILYAVRNDILRLLG